MTDLVGRIAHLSAQERAALVRLLRQPDQAGAAAAATAITAQPRDGGPLTLSFSQERIWFLEQFTPGTAYHNMSGVARIPLRVDGELFTDCVNDVVARHEILRTRFVVRDGEPAAVAAPRLDVPVRVLPEMPAEERDRLFQSDATQPFDLGQAPLLRVTLAPDPGGDTLVQLTMHHIVSDGFSTGVLFQELGDLYRMRLAGMQAGLPPLPFQFADVAAWERQQIGTPAYEASLRYWADHLRGAPQRLVLPADHPRPSRMTNRGRRLQLDLPAALTARVQDLSRRLAVTPFVTLLAAFAATLSRYAAQDDLIVGVPVANRELHGVEQLIGPFLNTLALRVDLTGEPRFADLVRQVNRTFLAGLEHQQVPFERVLQQVQEGRDPGRSPLFQAVFNFQADQAAAGTPGSRLRDLHNGGSDFDMLFDIVSGASGMTAHIDYYCDVYEERTITGFAASYSELLRGAAADPERPVAELPLLSPRAYVDSVAHGPAMRYTPALLPDLVLDPARQDTGRVALIEGDRRITRGEVLAAATSLAARLRQQVAAPAGAPVAICLPRSADVVVAVLGVLMAGFNYVPLDPEYPAERLSFICSDAGVAAVVSRHDCGWAVPAVDAPTLWMDELGAADAGFAGGGAEDEDAERPAYTIYTSGSTGRPKGVQVSHRNVVNFLLAMRESPGLGPDDVLLAVTSPSFDIAGLEMLLPLACGAQTVIASAADVIDGTRLAALMQDRHVTVMQATPATWQLLLNSGWRGRPGLRALCGGEACPPALARALLVRCAEVWNMYGPTETTIWSTIHRIRPDDVASGNIPIGTPIANTVAAVVDAGLHPVPSGVLGELCLGGDGVSLGYHRRPDLTAAAFVTPPWFGGQRLYRTGDLVRARTDGTLQFAGRTDHQVKIRGFRIELGEIEAVLGSHPGVLRAASVAVENADDTERSIVAYAQLAADAADTCTPAVLQAYSAQRLPEYMIPSRIVILPEFPLTSNGKVDRAALPRPHEPAESGGGEVPAPPGFVAARTETEQAISAIWQDLLGLPQVGVTDSFFELGGHSLLATKLVFRIREVFGADLPLNVLFEGEPTVARLAALVVAGAADGGAEEPIDLAAEARLAEDIRPEPGAHGHSVRHPQHVLLTGATGFIGAFLLDELLRTTQATVFCLVRAASPAEGGQRIRDALTEYGIWQPGWAARIVPVIGTLGRPRLGLNRPQWYHLAAMVDVIYHCGAEVNFLHTYRALKPANVLGTEEILRLACTGSVKPVHFVSTIFAFSRFAYPPGTLFREDMNPLHDLDNTFGYTQSKWVSEQMVLQAGRRGLPVYVYRLGRIAGHSQTGAGPTYDFAWQVAKVGIEMAAAPVMDVMLDLTPVDYTVRALVHLSRQPQLSGKAFHLLSPIDVAEPDLVAWFEHYGYQTERLTFQAWCERVLRRAEQLSDRTAGALAPFLSGTWPLDRIPAGHFDQSNVEQGLAGSGIECPPPTEELLHTYLDYFRDSGYLPGPVRQPAYATTPSTVQEG